MEAFSQALEHVAAFHVHADDPILSQGEAELRDLALLRDAIEVEIAARARELVAFEGVSWAAAAAALAPTPASLRLGYGRAKSE
ncbi:hypothetical protein [Schaalia hyovaginalis]|uniref:hypothetical protein n=1 Tax=Schaalia hyovaginalis TaxID=29316 RepID=UPI0026ED6418|nr:hypothetical protein [Schaalia hyovaginalis]MCI6556884.1 hypothetical protein [Schaalia hyovaginalis]MDD7554431.1 hypothetical protein [Schaalia hyovaginalis]MDY3093972.1 hypothetical protein [Schaalia hyovaginalis]